MNLTHILREWGISQPGRVEPLTNGTNNTVRRVGTPHGDFVLRIYANTTDAARLGFEQDVLRQIERVGMPFAFPAALPTLDGEIYARLDGDGTGRLATLTRYIAGQPPIRTDLRQALAAGEALGLLDGGLAEITVTDEMAAASWRTYGDLEHCHPLVPDPRAALAALPVADAVRGRLVVGYDGLMAATPRLYATLPRQLVHEDFDPSNVLMEGERVTGILDFEFCSRDLRAMDLTVALSWWPVDVFGTGMEWPIMRALAEGFARHVRLADDEIAAIAVLFHLRAYTSLIHRLGRQRAGLSPMAAVIARAQAALEREDWLATHGERLTELLRETCGTS